MRAIRRTAALLLLLAALTAACSETGRSAGEEELLETVREQAGGIDGYIYLDMDMDGTGELVGARASDGDIYTVWYCGGESCEKLLEGGEYMDGCGFVSLAQDGQTHAAFNTYRTMGTVKRCSIFALRDGEPVCLAREINGNISVTDEGDIALSVDGYDGMYDPDIDGVIVHTSKDTYIFFDGEEYREYAAREISEEDFLRYGNAEALKEKIEEDARTEDTEALEFRYFARNNGMVHIQCNVREASGRIYYGYYTVRADGDSLPSEPGDRHEGQMAERLSSLPSDTDD